MTNLDDNSLPDGRVMLGKWHTNETPLLCIAEMSNFVFSVDGVVSSVTDKEFVFSAKGKDAKLTFRLDDAELVFLYAEHRELPAAADLDDESASRSGLTIALPARIPLRLPLPDVPLKRESVTFLER